MQTPAIRFIPALSLILALPVFSGMPAASQGVEALSGSLPLWEPGHAVTTSIKDALPVATYLRVDEDNVRPIPDDWVMGPGYYRSVIRTYCLHAGTYGPTKGDGYLIAPLKGDRTPLIRNVLLRSVEHPNIEQHDVQRLIWGIEDGAQWDSFDNGFKSRVAPLLAPNEIVMLNIEPKRAEVANEVKRRIGGLVPGFARKAVDTFAELRSKITGITDYNELERIAVKTGDAPWGKDSRKDVQPGPWSYVGDGFFIRAFPESYSTTTLEVYRVASAKVTKDDKGRITRFDSDGRIIETTYADEPSTEFVDGKSVRVWKFKTVTFRHPDGRTHVITDKGFVVIGSAAELLSGSTDNRGRLAACALGDGGLDDMGHYSDGLKTAFNPTDKKGQLDWIGDHLGRVSAAWNAASAALSGNPTDDASPKKFDPSHHTATPANTGKQRLAMSGFKK